MFSESFKWLSLPGYSYTQMNKQQSCPTNSQKIFPNSFSLALPIFQKICGISHILQFSSSKLPKFPLLGPSDSMSIGPSHTPSFVLNVVSRHLPVDTTIRVKRWRRLGIQGLVADHQWHLDPQRLMSIVQITAMSNSLHTFSIYWVAPLPSNSM